MTKGEQHDEHALSWIPEKIGTTAGETLILPWNISCHPMVNTDVTARFDAPTVVYESLSGDEDGR